ncbi:peptidase C1B, bleomycin hydrolase [Mycotypha africana]|uniref:peptidase C1B, bleomycin hydrolase n=1 Tax=Mycotypha africana TaxID=64632 RepID=UPI002301B781|nr:peptidase C1B, bleomycin hydrolase [Mycotypha africana]KAI8984612.1 peptidase C1B, bleomycin hydrolase [Mycotypha africana]
MDEKSGGYNDNTLPNEFAKLDLNEYHGAGSASLDTDLLAKYSRRFHENSKNLLAMSALIGNDPTRVLVNRKAALEDKHVFNVKLDLEGSATNQKSSGRCWLFAGCNVMRLAVIEKYKLSDDFELSQSYLFFYDKLEKANWFLENMIDLAQEDINDRVVQYLLQDPVGDGGQYDMLINLVEKYGVVPKSVYPETYSSSNSRRLNYLVTVKLREFTTQIRKAVRKGENDQVVRAMKAKMMEDIYRIMVIMLDEPPLEFNWQTQDKNGKYVSVSNLTPQKYFREVVGFPISQMVSLINDPRNAYNKLYTVDRLGNIVGGGPIRYINTTSENQKQLAVNVLKSNRPVWFGCDVGQFSNNELGAMDTKIYDYSLAFNVEFNLTKEERLLYKESMMTHAMVFTGVHLDENGKPVRWRVENSWGADTTGDKGFWVMTDEWFSSFVYQIVLHKKDVPRRLVDILDTEPIVLPAYDPMGALASPH